MNRAGLFVVCFLLIARFAWASSEEKFIYDPHNQRDPFIPLIDKDSPSGIRTIFTRPGEVVRLPLELGVSGVLQHGEEYFAIVNNKVMKVGQSVGQVKIVGIDKEKIIVEYIGKRFPIYLRKEKQK